MCTCVSKADNVELPGFQEQMRYVLVQPNLVFGTGPVNLICQPVSFPHRTTSLCLPLKASDVTTLTISNEDRESKVVHLMFKKFVRNSFPF